MANNKGRSGYINNTVIIETLSSYVGGGVVGMTPITSFEFVVRERNKELVRPRQDTTDGAYSTGVGGPIGMTIKLMGYFKGEGLPDDSFQNEFVYLNALACLEFQGVCLVERFREVGVIDQAIHYEIEFSSDNIFTNANIPGA